MLSPGDEIDLAIEKPAAGGRMLARHDGQIVFVHGAIPGERLRARIERVERQLAFASAIDLIEPSPDRREPATDLLCGGCSYAHIAYPRQLALKSEVIHDAFARLGRAPLEESLSVHASPEHGYRMRARFHVRDGRIGFYREGTHDVCDAGTTGQLLEESVAAVMAAVNAILPQAAIASAELAENVAADQRVLHLEPEAGAAISRRLLAAAMRGGTLTGCTTSAAGQQAAVAVGTPVVGDPLPLLTGGRAGSGTLRRHAESFFQANRFLLPPLVGTVLDSIPQEGEVLDLYAGVGLFSISMAQSGREGITAVEGDRTSAADLRANASACGAAVRVMVSSVEDFLRSGRSQHAKTIIVDPPRTGISRAAMEAVVQAPASRVIYVSCDPPTMARDARRLLDGGYRIASLRAFDLFPNTPHVEAVGVFERV
jgi:23S rRNA (uracil1939-C5)-methyltransferase